MSNKKLRNQKLMVNSPIAAIVMATSNIPPLKLPPVVYETDHTVKVITGNGDISAKLVSQNTTFILQDVQAILIGKDKHTKFIVKPTKSESDRHYFGSEYTLVKE